MRDQIFKTIQLLIEFKWSNLDRTLEETKAIDNAIDSLTFLIPYLT